MMMHDDAPVDMIYFEDILKLLFTIFRIILFVVNS